MNVECVACRHSNKLWQEYILNGSNNIMNAQIFSYPLRRNRQTLLIHHKQAASFRHSQQKQQTLPIIQGKGLKSFTGSNPCLRPRWTGPCALWSNGSCSCPWWGVEPGNIKGPFWPKSLFDAMISTLIDRILICGKMNDSLNLNLQNYI